MGFSAKCPPPAASTTIAPGTVLADCSAEFRAHFNRAGMIIAKGQGNYETLSEVRAPIFFLFTVKCPLVAAQIGEPTGTLVAKRTSAAASTAQELPSPQVPKPV